MKSSNQHLMSTIKPSSIKIDLVNSKVVIKLSKMIYEVLNQNTITIKKKNSLMYLENLQKNNKFRD